MAGSVSLPFVVIYLMLVFVEALGTGGQTVTAEYLSDGVPVSRITALREEGMGPGLYRIVGVGRDEAEPSVARVEASTLVGHHFLVYPPNEDFPVVVSLAPVYDQLLEPSRQAVRSLTIAEDEITSSGAPDVPVGRELHVIRMDGITLLSAPDPGVMLLVTGE